MYWKVSGAVCSGVNTQKLSPGELAELVPWNLEPVPWADNGFYYDGTLDGILRPSKHPAYYAGLYYPGTQRHDPGSHAACGSRR